MCIYVYRKNRHDANKSKYNKYIDEQNIHYYINIIIFYRSAKFLAALINPRIYFTLN